jgi:hypothetical protein
MYAAMLRQVKNEEFKIQSFEQLAPARNFEL